MKSPLLLTARRITPCSSVGSRSYIGHPKRTEFKPAAFHACIIRDRGPLEQEILAAGNSFAAQSSTSSPDSSAVERQPCNRGGTLNGRQDGGQHNGCDIGPGRAVC